jgi:hypothetical protein
MAKLVFQSPEARDHFRKGIAHALDTDSYFGDKGLHVRIEYLRTYSDEGKEYRVVTEEGGGFMYARKVECLVGIGYDTKEVNLTMRYTDRPKGSREYGEWKVMWFGGLIGHSDGSWLVHT